MTPKLSERIEAEAAGISCGAQCEGACWHCRKASELLTLAAEVAAMEDVVQAALAWRRFYDDGSTPTNDEYTARLLEAARAMERP